MSEQPQQKPQEKFNISGDASLENVQIGGIAGRDLNINQIQGKVVNVTVYDRISAPDGLSQQSVRTTKSLTPQKYRQRRVLLNKVKNSWIKGVLENSLHAQALIELRLEKRPQAIQRPFSKVEEFPESSRETLPEEIRVTDIFEQLGAGQTLLILGEPGTGKTISLLKLAERLIERAQQDLTLPIPVVLNLSSWTSKRERQTIAEWLVEELKDKYQVSKALGKMWIEQEQLTLLLDGLDEVKAERRNDCVRALNEFIEEHGITEMTVCSRVRDYENLSERLKLGGAICIQPLTSKYIDRYLEDAGESLEGLKTLLQQDRELKEFAKTPLNLSLMALTYEGYTSEEVLQELGHKKGRYERLFNGYIERMLQRKMITQRYSKKLVIKWLTWLARHMTETTFFIEHLQPQHLEGNLRWRNLYVVSYICIATLLTVLLLNLASLLAFQKGFNFLVIPFEIIQGLISATQSWNNLWQSCWSSFSPPCKMHPYLTVFFTSLLLLSYPPLLSTIILAIIFLNLIPKIYNKQIKLTERLNWSLKKINISFFQSLNRTKYKYIKSFNIVKLIWKNTGSDIGDPAGRLMFITLIVIIVFLYLSFITLLFPIDFLSHFLLSLPSEISDKMIPNQGIWNSLKYSFFSFIFCNFIFIILWLALSNQVFLLLGVLSGLLVGLFWGGFATIQHLSLRIVLCLSGNSPWNYARFLDYATERLFMQKVGGGYIFAHRMLMEHFAQME